jgi:tol-pal system protein YbgF
MQKNILMVIYMKPTHLFFMCILCMVTFTGCATTDDLRRVQGKVDGDMRALRSEIEKSNQEISKVLEDITALRSSQANITADSTDIQSNLQALRGSYELLQKDISGLTEQRHREAEELKNMRKQLDHMAGQIDRIEKIFEIGKKDSHLEEVDKGATTTKDTVTGKAEKDLAYASAYDMFKEGKYLQAREKFQNFLKQFPETEYSERAMFWIGECYYFEKKYEEAILEYDKLIKKYPRGERVSSALLKQGLSFLHLGDKASAKVILQQVVKDYPGTNQARIANSRLTEMK